MAAKPPKPPGNFLKSLLSQNNKIQKEQNNEEEQETQQCNSVICHTSTTDNCNTIPSTTTAITTTAKKPVCNCSNISIMHLFHEMKQEFPTIPDTVVAQCVNENCHQRENCLQMLRNELELNPIPMQSYPAKVLHQSSITSTNNNNNNCGAAASTPTSSQKPPLQQKPQLVQQKPPLKPLRPVRTAPLQPPTSTTTQNSTQLQKPPNSSPGNIITTATNRNKLHSKGENNVSVCDGGEFNDMPSIISPQYKQTPLPQIGNSTNEVNNNNEIALVCSGGESIERNLPKQRPTTLNLNTHQENQHKQQRQRLNIQLQQHFQEQRNKQQHQPQHTTTKPTRKAPLPPIAPKPSQYQYNSTAANSVGNNNNQFNDTLSSTHTSPLSESEISVSVSLSTPSPTSSQHNTIQHSSPIHQQHQALQQTKSPIRHRSVITLQPEPPYTRDFASATSNALVSSNSANSSPTTSLCGSQKSFTSVNLTLRPPVTPTGCGTPGTALQQPSTIDITAGPGFSGASGGGKSLHYSSTSYDARLGYQQNFQITVTDEGGVFSASRIRPQQHRLNQVNICENQYDDGNSGVENNSNNNNYVNSLYAEQQQNLQQQQQQQQLYLLKHQQFHNNNVVASQQNIQNSINSPQGIGVGGIGGKMCVPPQQALDGFTAEVLQRQKKRRDKLAAALRENKKRLGQVEQEINLITGPIPTGLSERLDIEIQKLRTDCQAMLRSSNPFTQQQQQLQQQQQQQLAMNQSQQQQQPQPFPRQRPARPPPRPPPPRQTSLDFIQHHSQSQTSTPHTPPAASLPNLNMYNTPSPILAQHHPQHLQHSSSISPSFYHHQQQQQQQQPANITTEDIYSDTDEEEYANDGNDDDDYDVVEPWECNMCTFRNHPQLNICEACDNVRILPGTLPNLSRAISNNSANSIANSAVSNSPTIGLLSVSSNANGANDNNSSNILNASSPNGNLEHDTNLAQQQLQHFALHT